MLACHRGGDTDTSPGNGSPGSLTTWSAPHLPKGALTCSLPLRHKLRGVAGCLLRKAHLSTPQEPPRSCPSSPAADKPLGHQANSGEMEVRFHSFLERVVSRSSSLQQALTSSRKIFEDPGLPPADPGAPASGGWGSLGAVPPGLVLWGGHCRTPTHRPSLPSPHQRATPQRATASWKVLQPSRQPRRPAPHPTPSPPQPRPGLPGPSVSSSAGLTPGSHEELSLQPPDSSGPGAPHHVLCQTGNSQPTSDTEPRPWEQKRGAGRRCHGWT